VERGIPKDRARRASANPEYTRDVLGGDIVAYGPQHVYLVDNDGVNLLVRVGWQVAKTTWESLRADFTTFPSR